MTLFAECAQGIESGFSIVDGGEAAAVTEICQRLDGIPLAIELAASRIASMTAVKCVIALITGSGCWSVRGADWNVTTRCATRWPGPMTCSTTRKRRS